VQVGLEDPREQRAVSEARIAGTLPERIFFKALLDRGMREGIDFTFQSSLQGGRLFLGGMVADFILTTRSLIVRIQGRKWHTGFEQERKDDFQRDILEGMGYHVLDLFDDTIYDDYLFAEWLRRHIDVHPSMGGFLYDPEMGEGDLTVSVANELRDLIQNLEAEQKKDKARIEELEGLVNKTATHPHLQVDTTNIANVSAGKITAGSIKTEEYIQSTGFTAGSTGFQIKGEGDAEFGNITARGSLKATSQETGIVSAHGGTMVILPDQGTLISAVSTTDSSIDIKTNSLTVGSNILFQSSTTRYEWMRVREAAMAITTIKGVAGFRFPVDRAIAGTATAWEEGEVCGGWGRAFQDGQRSNNWGEPREGATAGWSNLGAGWGGFGVDKFFPDAWARIEGTHTDSPYYTIEERSSVTPDSGTTQLGRYGKVDGFLAYSAGAGETGFAVGDTTSNLTWDTTSGLKMEVSGGKLELTDNGIELTEDSVGQGDWIVWRNPAGDAKAAINKSVTDEQLYLVNYVDGKGVLFTTWTGSAYKNFVKVETSTDMGTGNSYDGGMSIKFYDGDGSSSDLVAEMSAGADSSANYHAEDLTIGAKRNTHFETDIHATRFLMGGFAQSSFYIKDGITAPSASSGYAYIYVDSADGDLKVKFGDDTVKTLATDT
jgi:very-short-patch-repair endonuclease